MAVASSAPIVDTVTIVSLASTVVVLLVAYLGSLRLLPSDASKSSRILFVWHLFNGLIHFVFEGSFLYNCFNTYVELPTQPSYYGTAHTVFTPPGVFFLGHRQRLYGPKYGDGPTAKLWQEYAKADKRWGGADLTIISLELLTVFIGGPLAMHICNLLRKGHGDVSGPRGRRVSGSLAFALIVLATGELYGGFMTFAPEWLSGNANLDTSNFMYMWVYLFFFNMLWVFMPLYSLITAYGSLTGSDAVKKLEEKLK